MASTHSALLVSWDDSSAVQPLKVVLQQTLGYSATSLQLPRENSVGVLNKSLASALASHTGRKNPFILYCHGDSLIKSGQSRLHLTNNDKSVSLDWLELRQKCLDEYSSDMLVILDCNHVATQRGRRRWDILEDDKCSESKSNLQILVAPRAVDQITIPFAAVLADALRAECQSSPSGVITTRDLVSGIANYPNLGGYASIFSLRPNNKDLELTICPSEREDNCAVTSGDSRGRGYKPSYSRVVVLPIAWTKVDDYWDPEAELNELVGVFRTNFDFTIEAIVKIPNTSSADSFLERRLDRQIEKLGNDGLLIVLYNGHARRQNREMFLSGNNYDGHKVNWTQLTHKLNIAPCDVVHVLDCCDALSATKGRDTEKQQRAEIAKAADLRTGESQFHGINETLAAGGRQQKVPAGSNSSMKIFAQVLHEMVSDKTPISIFSWHQHIIARVGSIQTEDGFQRFMEPQYKINPMQYIGQSIALQRKQRRMTT